MKHFARSTRGPVAALCGVLATYASIGALAADSRSGWTLAAVTDDVDIAVFRDKAGVLQTITIGERLPGVAWRLVAVLDGRAILAGLDRLHGQAVELRLAIGDRVAPPPADTIVGAVGAQGGPYATEHMAPRAPSPSETR